MIPSDVTATELAEKVLELTSPIDVERVSNSSVIARGYVTQPRIFSTFARWLESRGCEIASKSLDRTNGRRALVLVLVNVPRLTGSVIQPLVVTLTFPKVA